MPGVWCRFSGFLRSFCTTGQHGTNKKAPFVEETPFGGPPFCVPCQFVGEQHPYLCWRRNCLVRDYRIKLDVYGNTSILGYSRTFPLGMQSFSQSNASNASFEFEEHYGAKLCSVWFVFHLPACLKFPNDAWYWRRGFGFSTQDFWRFPKRSVDSMRGQMTK